MPISSAVKLALFLTLVAATACSSSTSSGSGNGASGATPAGTTAAGTASNGTCDSACVFYLACKGLGAENQQLCIDSCISQGWTSPELVELEAMECAEAVPVIERGRGGSTSSSGSSSGGSSSGAAKDCFGCQHDGTSCIYIGPMGGSSQCDPSCC